MLSTYEISYFVRLVGDNILYISPAIGRDELLWATFFFLLIRHPYLRFTLDFNEHLESIFQAIAKDFRGPDDEAAQVTYNLV
jgi:hypothetical protein